MQWKRCRLAQTELPTHRVCIALTHSLPRPPAARRTWTGPPWTPAARSFCSSRTRPRCGQLDGACGDGTEPQGCGSGCVEEREGVCEGGSVGWLGWAARALTGAAPILCAQNVIALEFTRDWANFARLNFGLSANATLERGSELCVEGARLTRNFTCAPPPGASAGSLYCIVGELPFSPSSFPPPSPAPAAAAACCPAST